MVAIAVPPDSTSCSPPSTLVAVAPEPTLCTPGSVSKAPLAMQPESRNWKPPSLTTPLTSMPETNSVPPPLIDTLLAGTAADVVLSGGTLYVSAGGTPGWTFRVPPLRTMSSSRV
jgi:hypothetical protein